MNIVVLDGKKINPGDNPWSPLEVLGTLTVYDTTIPEQALERSQEADILIINRVKITNELIGKLPRLKCIGVLATGYDMVDIKAAGKHGIPVINAVAYGINSVAQHAFALLLGVCRHTVELDAGIRKGEWSRPDDFYLQYPQIDLTGKCLGIIGYGNIGEKVGYIAHAFDMSVVAYTPSSKSKPSYSPFSFVSCDEVFRQADVLSLHCPLTLETYQLVNNKRIAIMKDDTILINVSRGALIDEQAVADALISGKLGGLGTDVAASEPIVLTNPLLSAPNTLFTPHIAWASLHARQNLIRILAENLQAWIHNNPKSVVNTEYLI